MSAGKNSLSHEILAGVGISLSPVVVCGEGVRGECGEGVRGECGEGVEVGWPGGEPESVAVPAVVSVELAGDVDTATGVVAGVTVSPSSLLGCVVGVDAGISAVVEMRCDETSGEGSEI